MLRNVKARHFRLQAYSRFRWEWKYPCRLRKTVETCRMVKRDEPNHHTISHTPPFLDRFCRQGKLLRLSAPPVIARCRLRGRSRRHCNGRRHARSMPPRGCLMCALHPAVVPVSILPDGSIHRWRRSDAPSSVVRWTHPEWETGRKVLHRKNGRCPSGR